MTANPLPTQPYELTTAELFWGRSALRSHMPLAANGTWGQENALAAIDAALTEMTGHPEGIDRLYAVQEFGEVAVVVQLNEHARLAILDALAPPIKYPAMFGQHVEHLVSLRRGLIGAEGTVEDPQTALYWMTRTVRELREECSRRHPDGVSRMNKAGLAGVLAADVRRRQGTNH
jgi:hypothetical protein